MRIGDGIALVFGFAMTALGLRLGWWAVFDGSLTRWGPGFDGVETTITSVAGWRTRTAATVVASLLAAPALIVTGHLVRQRGVQSPVVGNSLPR